MRAHEARCRRRSLPARLPVPPQPEQPQQTEQRSEQQKLSPILSISSSFTSCHANAAITAEITADRPPAPSEEQQQSQDQNVPQAQAVPFEQHLPGIRRGIYCGVERDIISPDNNVEYQVTLFASNLCKIVCTPQRSFFCGGQPPWYVEGEWRLVGDEVVVQITLPSEVGPRLNSEQRLRVTSSSHLLFGRAVCVWREDPPEPIPRNDVEDGASGSGSYESEDGRDWRIEEPDVSTSISDFDHSYLAPTTSLPPTKVIAGGSYPTMAEGSYPTTSPSESFSLSFPSRIVDQAARNAELAALEEERRAAAAELDEIEPSDNVAPAGLQPVGAGASGVTANNEQGSFNGTAQVSDPAAHPEIDYISDWGERVLLPRLLRFVLKPHEGKGLTRDLARAARFSNSAMEAVFRAAPAGRQIVTVHDLEKYLLTGNLDRGQWLFQCLKRSGCTTFFSSDDQLRLHPYGEYMAKFCLPSKRGKVGLLQFREYLRGATEYTTYPSMI